MADDDKATLLKVDVDASQAKAEMRDTRAVGEAEIAKLREAFDQQASIDSLPMQYRQQLEFLKTAGIDAAAALAHVRSQMQADAAATSKAAFYDVAGVGGPVETEESKAGQRRAAEQAAAAIKAESDAMQAQADAAAALQAQIAALTQRERELFETYRAFGGSDVDNLQAAKSQAGKEGFYQVTGLAEEHKKLGEAAKVSQKGIRDFGQVVSFIDPAMGQLIQTAIAAKEALTGMLLTPEGAIIAIAVASIALLTQGVKALTEECQQATEASKELYREQLRLSELKQQDRDTVQKALAKAGIFGEETVDKGQKLEDELVNQKGVSRETARQVIPFAFNKSGDQIRDLDQLLLLAGYQDFGPGGLEAGGNDKQRKEALKAAEKDFKINPELAASRANVYGSARRRQSGMIADQMDPANIARRLKENPFNVDDSKIEQAVKDIQDVAKLGHLENYEDEIASGWQGRKKEESIHLLTIRQQEAAQRARALGILNTNDSLRAQSFDFYKGAPTINPTAQNGSEQRPSAKGAEEPISPGAAQDMVSELREIRKELSKRTVQPVNVRSTVDVTFNKRPTPTIKERMSRGD